MRLAPSPLAALALLVACRAPTDSGLLEVSAKSVEGVARADSPPSPSEAIERVAARESTRLLVTVQRLEVEVAGRQRGWHSLPVASDPLDLFDPSGAQRPLAAAPVPAGRVTQLRVSLADDVRYEWPHGAASVRCPSCGDDFELSLPGDATLRPGDVAHLVLVFDRDDSLWSSPVGFDWAPALSVEVTPPFRWPDPRVEE